MSRSVLASLGLTVLAVLATPTHAQQSPQACKLLQVAEVESALGGKASDKPSGSSQSVPGMTLDECHIVVSGPGRKWVRTATVNIVSNLPMDGGDAIRTIHAGTAREKQWKVNGARLEQQTAGTTICILHGRPGIAGHSTCSIPRGKGYVEVNVTASDEMASLDVVRALVEKAFSRL